MACERCGGVSASDGATLDAVFETASGQPLHMVVRLVASHDALGLRAAMFCAECWVFFVEQFGARLAQKRVLCEPSRPA